MRRTRPFSARPSSAPPRLPYSFVSFRSVHATARDRNHAVGDRSVASGTVCQSIPPRRQRCASSLPDRAVARLFRPIPRWLPFALGMTRCAGVRTGPAPGCFTRSVPPICERSRRLPTDLRTNPTPPHRASVLTVGIAGTAARNMSVAEAPAGSCGALGSDYGHRPVSQRLVDALDHTRCE